MNKLYWSVFSVCLAIGCLVWLEYRLANIYVTPVVERLDRLSNQVAKLSWDLSHLQEHVGYNPPPPPILAPATESNPSDSPWTSDGDVPPIAGKPVEAIDMSAPGANFYVFPVGTMWEFEQTTDYGKGHIDKSNTIYKVIGLTENSVLISTNLPKQWDIAWSVVDGRLCWDYKDSDKIFVLKLGSKKGDIWDSPDAKVTNLGSTNIAITPMGQFIATQTLVKLQFDGHESEIEYSLAPGTGPVKIVVRSQHSITTLVLTKFTKR